ncbi:hypothetical protein H0H81_005184 [Sphagnurus paluster]|uniref:Uncharacterized protein n=1 Tax=Sphagnurus paluster TaxID=117069 RepID=A0A9P7GLR0_9AGAR|nr:hypothetical protein H0H81_005184 [Sphagnurus paluster]
MALTGPTFAAVYRLTDQIGGGAFYDAFDFQAIPDPTHGRVNYVDRGTAQAQNLTFATSPDTFIMRADFKNKLNPAGAGRNSVRIRSKRVYKTHVAATWPAIWETNEAAWPNGGETDIMEGANDKGSNAATLHTSAGCVMPANRVQTGTNTQLQCDVGLNFNAGCGVQFKQAESFGPAFNRAGGGWYAMERTPTFIKVWFWSRNDRSLPADLRNPGPGVNTDSWGTPAAFFPNTSCDLNRFFNQHNIIINLTLCGDWAGNTYPSTCPLNCVDHVNNNPGAFQNAYFDFKGIRIYEP